MGLHGLATFMPQAEVSCLANPTPTYHLQVAQGSERKSLYDDKSFDPSEFLRPGLRYCRASIYARLCCFLDVGADFVNKDVSAAWLRKYRTSHALWVDHERDIIKEYAEGGGGSNGCTISDSQKHEATHFLFVHACWCRGSLAHAVQYIFQKARVSLLESKNALS